MTRAELLSFGYQNGLSKHGLGSDTSANGHKMTWADIDLAKEMINPKGSARLSTLLSYVLPQVDRNRSITIFPYAAFGRLTHVFCLVDRELRRSGLWTSAPLGQLLQERSKVRLSGRGRLITIISGIA
jgi:hypothetical protein